MVTLTLVPVVVPESVGVVVLTVWPEVGLLTLTVGTSTAKLTLELALPPKELLAAAVAV